MLMLTRKAGQKITVGVDRPDVFELEVLDVNERGCSLSFEKAGSDNAEEMWLPISNRAAPVYADQNTTKIICTNTENGRKAILGFDAPVEYKILRNEIINQQR